ncbi:MAG: hypothetical protein ASARMPRED_004803 [Alectoria sarmentosa]|nr:MAG: hypothetical protein ASARMPRED_004803 [Alectoria sarmentosa]
MASTVSNLTRLGDPKHGGALFTLPREIRDEIYRLLIKGCYLIYAPLVLLDRGNFRSSFRDRKPRVHEPDLTIFRISQAISHEAQEIYYSESIFRYEIHFAVTEALKPPTQVVNRMKKVEIDIRGLTSKNFLYQDDHPIYKRRIAEICGATIDDFMGAQILRDTILVRFFGCKPEMITSLSRNILPKLRAFNGFRTIFVEIWPHRIAKQKELPENMDSDGQITTDFEQIRQSVKDAMEPTLGPATTRINDFTIYLKFRPRQHVPAILRAQAQKLVLDAERMMLEAERLEQRG